MDADGSVSTVPRGADLSLLDMDFDDVGAFVADDLIGAVHVVAAGAILYDVFPGAYDFAAGVSALNAVVDAPVGSVVSAGGLWVGVFVDSVDGVAYSVGGARGSGSVVGPWEGCGVGPGAAAAGGGRGAEGDEAIGAKDKLVFPDTEEVERIRDVDGALGILVVDVCGHACSEGEGGVRWVVGDFIDGVLAVEELCGDVGGAGEHDAVAGVAVDDGVPAVVAVLAAGGVVVFLFDLHFGAGRLCEGPLVFSAVDGGAGVAWAERALAVGQTSAKEKEDGG